eukprot:TRINITY_DN12887_c0_g1_i7.p3 TRINITY_DN12887_c0_g1~~TRINITY_DN12887_c0_g1_i7.p3  ORF type:complete len:140 (+),score=2.53 TRINITY_DN12887_c0_g1_i7:112-531(+)
MCQEYVSHHIFFEIFACTFVPQVQMYLKVLCIFYDTRFMKIVSFKWFFVALRICCCNYTNFLLCKKFGISGLNDVFILTRIVHFAFCVVNLFITQFFVVVIIQFVCFVLVGVRLGMDVDWWSQEKYAIITSFGNDDINS